jgi:hypothetical protein
VTRFVCFCDVCHGAISGLTGPDGKFKTKFNTDGETKFKSEGARLKGGRYKIKFNTNNETKFNSKGCRAEGFLRYAQDLRPALHLNLKATLGIAQVSHGATVSREHSTARRQQ